MKYVPKIQTTNIKIVNRVGENSSSFTTKEMGILPARFKNIKFVSKIALTIIAKILKNEQNMI